MRVYYFVSSKWCSTIVLHFLTTSEWEKALRNSKNVWVNFKVFKACRTGITISRSQRRHFPPGRPRWTLPWPLQSAQWPAKILPAAWISTQPTKWRNMVATRQPWDLYTRFWWSFNIPDIHSSQMVVESQVLNIISIFRHVESELGTWTSSVNANPDTGCMAVQYVHTPHCCITTKQNNIIQSI